MKSKLIFHRMLMVMAIAALSACMSAKEADGDNGVWICTGPKSKKYHAYEDCRGLSSCSGDLVRISIEEAEEMGRDACKICRRHLKARAKTEAPADSVTVTLALVQKYSSSMSNPLSTSR